MSEKFTRNNALKNKQFSVEMLNRHLLEFKIKNKKGYELDFTITLDELKELIMYVENKI